MRARPRLVRQTPAWALIVLGAACAITSSSTAHAEEVTVEADRDSCFRENGGDGGFANGAGSFLVLGRPGGPDDRRRVLLHFDLSAIPTDATVDDATLQLTILQANNGLQPATWFAVTRPWTEGPSLVEGAGSGPLAPVELGDSDWLHASYDSELWTTPGGDFDPTPLASASHDAAGPASFADPALTAVVQDWVSDPSLNLGLIGLGDERAPSTTHVYASREDGDADARPRLVVSYTIADGGGGQGGQGGMVGAGGSTGGGGSGGDDPTATATTSGGAAPPATDEGCSCRLTGSQTRRSSVPAWCLATLLLALRRRRARRLS